LQCTEGDKQIANLLNAGKMELMKNAALFRDNTTKSSIVEMRDEGEDGNPELPKTVDDIDKVNLGNVVVAA
jgi:hypothetical protein